MNFGLPFTFPFEDPDWLKKIALAALVSLIPVVGQFFIMGWMLEITRRVIKGESPLLPDLDFGQNLGTGFKAWVIGLVYALPMIVFALPMMIVGAAGGAAGMDEETLAIVISAISCCCGGLMFLYGILMAFMMPAAYGKFLESGVMGDAFKVKDVFAMVKAAPVAFLIAIGGAVIASFIAPLGGIAIGIGAIFTTAYAMAIMGHFYGQAYNEAKAAM
ncbi:MAG: DUF4013 domain-containing protein [Anaerolineaceae bacterium]|nr:DUF4013 domain-containing protein [Anaerolineaceae bacterium]